MLKSLSFYEILLPRYVNCTANFTDLLLKVGVAPCLKRRNSALPAFTKRLILAPGCAAGIRFGQMYLLEVLDHLRSLRLLQFLFFYVCVSGLF